MTAKTIGTGGGWMPRCAAHYDHTRANDPARLRRETAWGHAGQPKPIFGLDTPPLNVAGGHQFPGAPHVADVFPGSRAARTPTAEAKVDSDGLDIRASRVRRPTP